MGRLLSYLGKCKKETILAPLFKMMEACLELCIPLLVAQMIDVGIRNHDKAFILRNGGIMILFGVIGLTVSLTAQYFAAKAAVKIGTSFRNDLFRHINALSYSEIDSLGYSALETRMTSDINQVQNGVNMFLRLFLRSPFVVIGAMVMAFIVDRKAAIIFAVVIPILFALVLFLMLVTVPFHAKVQNKLSHVLSLTRENLFGVRVVRAFNRQKMEQQEYQSAASDLYRSQMSAGRISALLNPLSYVVINLGIIAILYRGGGQVMDGTLKTGQVVALVNYMSQILVEVIKLADLLILLSKSLACLKRVDGVFQVGGSMQEGEFGESFTKAPVVSFRDVSFSYPGAKEPAVSHIHFEAPAGATIGIIGGTGSGKSTLVQLIPRFYDVTEGSVLVDGRNVRDYRFRALRSHMGIVPQKSALLHGTIRKNMQWGKRDATDEEIRSALHTAQADFVFEKKEGLDLMVEHGAHNFSGGQKQRLTIARALVRQPQILILDDSASALDFATDAKLRKALKEETGDMTVFLVSQRISTVRNSDLILVLNDGEQAGLGTHEELMRSCPIYQEIYASQIQEKETYGVEVCDE